MSEIIEKLKNLGQLDANIARTISERRKTEEGITAREKEIQTKKILINQVEAAYNAKHEQYNKEEKRLRDERTKLKERAAALDTITNYKLMEAAQKEIQAAEEEIGNEEELILTHIDEADEIKAKLDALKEEFSAFSKESETFIFDSKETIEGLNEREAIYRKKREEAAALVDKGSLIEYEKSSKKYPTDPIVAVNGKICQGCFVALPPVQLSELAGDSKLINCRGCKRIVYLATD